jgi:hypothetical protein
MHFESGMRLGELPAVHRTLFYGYCNFKKIRVCGELSGWEGVSHYRYNVCFEEGCFNVRG